GQAIGAVLARILGVADTDQGDLKQAHGGGQHLFPARAAPGQVVLDALAQTGQGAGESGQALELVLCGMGRPVGMIAVLLAPARIARCSLNMAGGARTDPDSGPGRRDGQAADAVQRGGVPDQASVRIPIAEAATGATASQAGAVIIAPG